MSLGVEKLLPSDCLNINEFRAIHMNRPTNLVHMNIYKNRSYCLNFIISAGNINSLSNSLV